MVIRKAYLIDIDYTYKKGQTYVRLLVKGKRKTIRLYYPYDPYFYAEIPIERMEELSNMRAYSKEGHVVSPKDVKEAELLHGIKKKKVVKVICAQPSDVPIIRNAIPFPCFEDGISFGRRFIFDFRLTPNGILKYEREGRIIKRIISCEQATPQLSSMAFDIETYNPQGASRENIDPVIMVSWSGKESGGVLSTKGNSKEYLQLVQSEKEMIERFSEIVKNNDPDILFGYNSANFDIPYLRDRAKISGARFFPGRFRSALQTNKRGLNSGLKVAGRVHIDIYPMMRFFGHIGMIKTHDYKLESIANALLKNQKKQMKRLEIWKLWDEGKVDELAEYSFMDSQVTRELGEKYLGIELELSSLAKLSLYDTALATSGQLVENLLMYEASGKGMLIPPKPSGGAISERLAAPIQGAYVKLPAPGVYDNIAVLDFRGLYPSIICSYNIDPGTLVKGNDADNANLNPDNVFVSPSGAVFLKEPKGLVPYVLDYLIDFRSVIKKKLKVLDKDSDEYKMLLARSTAIKVVSNSFYGYLAYARSRYYSRECGESVTAYGRKHITETIEKAERSGFKVLYADTDSTFLLMENNNKDDVLKFMKEVNAALPEKMELELEGFFPRGVFVSKKGAGGEKGAKKKYALLGEDGRIKIRGFELVRRDWSAIAKNTQRAVLEAILKDGSKEKAVKIVRETIERINSGKVGMEELTIVTQIRKDPRGGYAVSSPELSAASKAIARGVPVQTGSVISYVITKSGKSISEKAVPVEFATDYDPAYYVNNQLLPAVMKILEELGYDEYSLKVGGKQKTLEFF